MDRLVRPVYTGAGYLAGINADLQSSTINLEEGAEADFAGTNANRSTITANNSTGPFPTIFTFSQGSRGGKATIRLFGSGLMDLSSISTTPLTIGSLEGDGPLFLGNVKLTVGANNKSTK